MVGKERRRKPSIRQDSNPQPLDQQAGSLTPIQRLMPKDWGHGHILRNDDPSNDISRLLEDDCLNTLLEWEPACRLLKSHEYFEDNGHYYFLYLTNLQGTCIRAICQSMQNVFEVYSLNAIRWIVILKDMSFSFYNLKHIWLESSRYK